ncbi:MAG: PASTA domain-containing protein, partial [Clostridia bacterium]|nr:PASTA domain-containing protein [Clostridia bacterium]
PTLSTLGTLHSNGIIHRGMSPSTRVIGEDGKIKITGFSIGDVRTVGSRLNPQIFDGYAAAEQYGFDVRQGPWTDIYAFTAVLYRTLIGSDPISAQERMANDRLMVPGKFAEALPAYVINGLINGLQILPQDRTKTVEQLRAELSASPAATAVSTNYGKDAPAPTIPSKSAQIPVRNTPKKKEKSNAAVFFIALASVLVVGAVALGIMLISLDKSGKINLRHPGQTVTETQTQVEQVKVPDFSVSNYDSIQANPVFNRNFKITANEVFDANLPKGSIISQSIPADTMVPKGSSIVLTVSKGAETIVLPDVVGKKYDDAFDQLTGLGFEVERMDVTQSGWYSEDEVIEMSLTENQEYDVGTTVTLKVYTQQVTEEFSTRRSYSNPYTAPSQPESTSSAPVPTEPASQIPVSPTQAENQ